MNEETWIGLHKGIVDGDNENLAGILELWVGDEARDVGVRARWAWKSN